jgi:hypothetical protein
VDDKVTIFHDTVETIYREHCPERRVRVREKDPLLLTPLIIKLRRAKNRLYKNGNIGWKYFAGLISQKLRKIRKEHCEKHLNSITNDSKKWWKNLKSLTEPSQQGGPERLYINEKWMTPSEFVETQNDHSLSVTSHMTIDVSQTVNTDQADPLPLPPIGEVKARLRKINTQKATHSSDYPSWITKENAEDLAIPLTNIIHAVLLTGKFPSKWKAAEIVPLNKVANPQTSKDFRPISLLWHCGKIVEFFVVKCLRNELNHKLNENQYAYTQGKGTTDALVYTLTDWVKKLDQKNTLAVHGLPGMDYSLTSQKLLT